MVVIVVVFIYCLIFFTWQPKTAVFLYCCLFVCLFVLPDIKKVSVSNFICVWAISMSLEKGISALLIENLPLVIHTYDVGIKTRPKGYIVNKLQPRLCGSSLDF